MLSSSTSLPLVLPPSLASVRSGVANSPSNSEGLLPSGSRLKCWSWVSYMPLSSPSFARWLWIPVDLNSHGFSPASNTPNMAAYHVHHGNAAHFQCVHKGLLVFHPQAMNESVRLKIFSQNPHVPGKLLDHGGEVCLQSGCKCDHVLGVPPMKLIPAL